MKVIDVNTLELPKVLEDLKGSNLDGSVVCTLVIYHTNREPCEDDFTERVKGRKSVVLLYLINAHSNVTDTRLDLIPGVCENKGIVANAVYYLLCTCFCVRLKCGQSVMCTVFSGIDPLQVSCCHSNICHLRIQPVLHSQ